MYGRKWVKTEGGHVPVLVKKKKKFSHKKNTVEPPLSGTWPLNGVAAQ